MYHISKCNKPLTMIPRIPNNFFTKNGFEDNKTPRVCFSNTIDGCIMALSHNCEGETYYVHTPEKHFSKYKNKPNSYVRKVVPDASITGECWILEEVKTKVIDKILITKPTNKSYSFTYGDNKTAELWKWSWKHVILEDINRFICNL